MPRTITWDLRIDWNFDGTYTDESARLVSATGGVRLASPESGISSPRGTVDQCQLILNNADGRYSPLNTSSPLYNDIKLGGAYHAPMYLRVSIDASTYYRVFTGVIKIPRDNPPYPGTAATVEIDCRSRDELLLNKRISTTQATFVALHEDGATEADIIAQFLDDAGLSSGDYTLDPGLFVVPWAWLDDESPIEDIWNLAAACGGRFYCDQDGEFRYENMTHWLLAARSVTSQETLTKAGYGQMDGPLYDDRELYNGVTVIASPRETLESGDLWAADQTLVIPAGSTKTITAKLRQPAYVIDAANFTAVTAGSRSMDGDISISMAKYAQRVELSITNANATYAAELVALTLTGIPVSGSPSIEETFTSSAGFWASYTASRPGRTRLLRGNVYVQTQPQAAALAEFLRDRYQLPRLSWRLRNAPGDPERRLGDRVTVGNADAMSSNRDAFLIAIDWRLSDRGFVQDLELIDAGDTADGTGIYVYDEYFVLGTHELGSGGGADDARIFY